MSVRVLGTVNRGALDDCRCLAGIATLVRSLRYAGVDVTIYLFCGVLVADPGVYVE